MTMTKRNDLIPQVETLYKNYGGYVYSEFNHFGVDNPESPMLDGFNDVRGVYMPIKGELWIMTATTGPGKECILKKEGGAAKLDYGFWDGAHVIDTHCYGTAFAHTAFCQRPRYGCKPMTIIRLDREGRPTDVKQTSNDFGINVHRASIAQNLDLIGPYSEGCQVARDHSDHEREMAWAMETTAYKKNARVLWPYLLCRMSEINL